MSDKRRVDGMINLMRGLQPPTVGQSPATDAELALLELSRDTYDALPTDDRAKP